MRTVLVVVEDFKTQQSYAQSYEGYGLMYGKIFSSIYDGTLGEDWRALITFQQMIILCDSDGVVDMTPESIFRRTNIPIEHIKAGIEILESKDPYSRTQGENGRRIIRLDEHRPWGWQIVNHGKYRDLNDYDKVKEQNRERQKRYRKKEKSNASNVTITDDNVKSRHTDTNTDTKTLEAFNTFWQHYPKKKNKGQARKAWLKCSPDKPLIEKIHQAIEVAKESDDWQKDKGKYIPYPATWLNAEGWDDHYSSEEVDLFGGAL